MQKTNFRQFLDALNNSLKPVFGQSWRQRSVLLLSLLFGFYFTNSLLSYLLDKSINTIFLGILIILIMEIAVQTSILSKYSKLSLLILPINNFRIGSTYALILEAYKLGS